MLSSRISLCVWYTIYKIGCYLGFCVKVRSEKALKPVQIGLPGSSAMRHYTKFGMASKIVTT